MIAPQTAMRASAMRLLSILAFAALVSATVQSPANAQSVGRSFRDCSDCPEMVSISPGSFAMGVPAAEEEREGVGQSDRSKGRSIPQHRVTIGRRLAIGKYAVTRGEFSAFAADTGYQTSDKCLVIAQSAGASGVGLKEQSGYSWRNPGFSQTDRHPVVCVSWDDAKAYVAWLSRKTAHSYRLPSEAEWEYAARAGSQAARFWGDDREQLCVYANTADLTFASAHKLVKDRMTQCSDGHTYTSPVGEFRPNAFGLHDMLGNVWQWVEDCWNGTYQGAPTDGSAWATGVCDQRVVRGGAWINQAWAARTGYRDTGDTGNRWSDTGFRVVRTP